MPCGRSSRKGMRRGGQRSAVPQRKGLESKYANCEYHGRFIPSESNDWQCPKCSKEVYNYGQWRRTGELKYAPLHYLQRMNLITKDQQESLQRQKDFERRITK